MELDPKEHAPFIPNNILTRKFGGQTVMEMSPAQLENLIKEHPELEEQLSVVKNKIIGVNISDARRKKQGFGENNF